MSKKLKNSLGTAFILLIVVDVSATFYVTRPLPVLRQA